VVLLLFLVILFIKVYKFGIDGVFLSQLIARSVVATVVITIDFWRVFKVKFVSVKIIMRLLSYSWPYFLISSFFWVMSSVDKFLGTQLLDTHEQIAYLALASQITLPIAMFVDVIRQAYGPYVMSIRKSQNANATYIAVFSLVIYLGVFIGIGLITVSPILILILADETFYPALKVIPYFTLAAIINLMIGKFSLGLNLTRNNVYIAIGTISGGLVGFIANYYLLQYLNVSGAGISQILAFTISAIIIYYFSNKEMKIPYEFGWALKLFTIFVTFNGMLLWFNSDYLSTFIYSRMVIGGVTLAVMVFIGNHRFKIFEKLLKNNKYKDCSIVP
jgi:O-antigen/teichoic acid export membrane protein